MMKRPETLSGQQRRQLRALAHDLEPIVRVGEKGVTAGVIEAVNQALDDHELIKVRILEGCPIDRKDVGGELAEPSGAHAVGLIGRICILYRRHPEKPKVPLRSQSARKRD